jgi:hypothetical protein
VKHARIAIVGLVAVILVGAGTVASIRYPRVTTHVVSIPTEERAPEGDRVRVQVMNATKTRGLARRATMLLRDRGYDVVESGTINDARDTTVVLDLSGHPEWAARIAKLLGSARVESRPDSSRYLDISILLGSAWRPPAAPFTP